MHLLIVFALFYSFYCSLRGSDFLYEYESYECPKGLVGAIERAVTRSLSLGRRPILACDIDETLVKQVLHKGIIYFVPTQFSMLLSASTLEKVYAVMALTARSACLDGLLGETQEILKGCSPDFYKYMTRKENFGGLALYRQSYLNPRNGFIYHNGLLMMGELGTTKRDALDTYLNLNPLEKVEYDLIFIDNDSGWFPKFFTAPYAVNIRFGYFFHYDFERCEQKMFNPLPAFSVIPTFEDLGDEWEVVDKRLVEKAMKEVDDDWVIVE